MGRVGLPASGRADGVATYCQLLDELADASFGTSPIFWQLTLTRRGERQENCFAY